MIRERIGRAALRAYPPAVRQARGLEMLGVLLDAGEHSSLALVRETVSLVLGGLRERAAITARVGIRRAIADSCAQAVAIWLTLWLVPVCVLVTLGSGGRVGPLEVLAVISMAGLLRLFRDPRLAIACGLVWVGVLVSHAVGLGPTRRPGPAGPGSLVILALACAGFMLAIAAGRLWIIRRGVAR